MYKYNTRYYIEIYMWTFEKTIEKKLYTDFDLSTYVETVISIICQFKIFNCDLFPQISAFNPKQIMLIIMTVL